MSVADAVMGAHQGPPCTILSYQEKPDEWTLMDLEWCPELKAHGIQDVLIRREMKWQDLRKAHAGGREPGRVVVPLLDTNVCERMPQAKSMQTSSDLLDVGGRLKPCAHDDI